MAIITVLTDIHAPIERVFDLARSIDAHVESAEKTGERAVGPLTSGLLNAGDEVTWRGRHFGAWQNFTSRITAFSRPDYFRDSMAKGAFKRMDHDHYFVHHNGVTNMRDVIEFAAPLGLLGLMAEKLVLRGYLRQFLLERNRVLKRIAEGTEWRRFLDPR